MPDLPLKTGKDEISEGSEMLPIFLNFLSFFENELSITKVLKFNLLASIFRDFGIMKLSYLKKNKLREGRNFNDIPRF